MFSIGIKARPLVIALALSMGMAATLTSTTASAQGPSCTDKKGAKREFVKGRLAYRRGDYGEAILKWQDSYAACAKPLTLFNIGNAYERMGDLKAALKHFEQYRPQAPKHEHADLDSRMEGLRTRIAEQDQVTAAQQAQLDAAAKAEADRKRREDWERAQAARKGKKGPWPIIGWSAVGVGGAAVIAGVVMDVIASSNRPDEAEACTDASGRLLCRDTQRDDIESSNTLAIAGDITWIAGSVIAAGGGAILILTYTGVLRVRATGGDRGANDSKDGQSNSAKNEPFVQDLELSPFGAGLMLHGRF